MVAGFSCLYFLFSYSSLHFYCNIYLRKSGGKRKGEVKQLLAWNMNQTIKRNPRPVWSWERGQYLGGMTTMGSPFFGRHISTWASLALGLTMALVGMGSFFPRICGCSWTSGSLRTARCPRGFSGSTWMWSCILQRMVCRMTVSEVAWLMATSQVVKLWSRRMLLSWGTLLSLTGTLQVTLG